MNKALSIVCPWVTPKVFPNFEDPAPRVRSFFDHYESWFLHAETVVLCFAAGNGDHILNYRGTAGLDDAFEWARYNCFRAAHMTGNFDGLDEAAERARLNAHNNPQELAFRHNLDWLNRVREGGERSYNPYSAGPSLVISEQVLTYRILGRFYVCFREEAQKRGINLKLLEYLEPGPEFCPCVWKTQLHPEGAQGNADAEGSVAQGVIDVCSTLREDSFPYAAFPRGIPAGTNTGGFVAAQTAAFVRDFELDGVYLGNQFGLIGFWDPKNAPPATPERREGVKRFFQSFRNAMGDKLIYWMDTYWPAEIEIEKWAMSEENYAVMDAVMCSNFAVLVERTQIAPNVESKQRISQKHGGRPAVLFSVDFVDPWYWYRTYLDDRKNFLFQHEIYRSHGARCQGVSFFANDTFGHWVMPEPLAETLQVILETHGKKQS